MSKSIYEVALEDLYYVIPVGYSKDMIGKTIQTKRLLDFIKQAQKQEKLLRLYKELSIAERKRATFLKTKTVDIYNQLTKVIEWLEKQIKEIEK